MTVCAVATCKSDSRKDKTLSFHTFPKSEKLRKIWVQFCRRKDNWNPSTSCLCSKHFEKKDFELNYREQLLNVKSKARLVKGSFPIINNEHLPPTERGNRMCAKKKALLFEELSDYSSQGSQENIHPSCSDDISDSLCRDGDVKTEEVDNNQQSFNVKEEIFESTEYAFDSKEAESCNVKTEDDDIFKYIIKEEADCMDKSEHGNMSSPFKQSEENFSSFPIKTEKNDLDFERQIEDLQMQTEESESFLPIKAEKI